MRYLRLTIMVLLTLITLKGVSQAVLPDITVRNERGRIIISWLNDYKIAVSHIHVQRSYDSLRNYSTIGSVINPGNLENGYPDENPPYARMFYRVLVSFENGQYLISKAFRPQSVKRTNTSRYFWEIPAVTQSVKATLTPEKEAPAKMKPDSSEKKPSIKNKPDSSGIKTRIDPLPEIIPENPRSIFVNKFDVVELHLPEAGKRKFRIRFTDKEGKTVIEIDDPKEEILFLEKVNFIRSGSYVYEITENGKPFEKGQIEIPKDIKKNQSINQDDQGRKIPSGTNSIPKTLRN